MAFVGYPDAFLYPEPNRRLSGRQSVEHHPWGHWVTTLDERRNGFVKVRDRWKDDQDVEHEFAWIREEDVQSERLLEVNFVDIGQGDGCFVVMPDDRRMVIDAGEGRNMYWFLRWRFNRRAVFMHDVVISHPDQDHYRGFDALADDEKFSFGNVYHNGIVERTGRDSLGPRTRGRDSELTDVIETPEQLDRILDSPSKVGRKRYPNLLKKLRDAGRTEAIWMLHVDDGFVPGYEADEKVSIRVLAPVPRREGDRLRLPWFSSTGKTKNGHSVVLRLTYGKASFLLGGDLNIPSEHYLLRHYTGLDPEPESVEELEDLLAVARPVFECDVMKACHHGSADVSSVFVQAVNAAATVISSGDGEPHAHPRPDALGVYGKYARGHRPLIFSTELARSAREFVSTPAAIQDRLTALSEIAASPEATRQEKADASREFRRLLGRRERAVAVYGLISARTDGERMIVTQKLEEKRSGTGQKWDIHRLEPGPDGRFRYLAKH